jgi:hypothetical protein
MPDVTELSAQHNLEVNRKHFRHIEAICRNVEIVRGSDFGQINPSKINDLILLRRVSGDALTFCYLFLPHKAEFGDEGNKSIFLLRCRLAVGLVSCSRDKRLVQTTEI